MHWMNHLPINAFSSGLLEQSAVIHLYSHWSINFLNKAESSFKYLHQWLIFLQFLPYMTV